MPQGGGAGDASTGFIDRSDQFARPGGAVRVDAAAIDYPEDIP
jgi:hypothetical protein